MLLLDVNESDFVANLGIKVCDMAMVHWCIGAVHWCIGALVVGCVMKNLKILGQKQINCAPVHSGYSQSRRSVENPPKKRKQYTFMIRFFLCPSIQYSNACSLNRGDSLS